MIPIQDLLNRIRWDKNYAQGDFEIGYHDRIANKIVRVAFEKIRFPAGEHFSFEVIDNTGEIRMIPFHRVKEVYKNKKLIWHREH